MSMYRMADGCSLRKYSRSGYAGPRWLKWRGALSIGTCVLGLWRFGTASAVEVFNFEVPEGPALTTLQDLAHQADNAQIMLDWKLLSSIVTQKVVGSLELNAALTAALAGTGIGYKIGDRRTITFRRLSSEEIAALRQSAGGQGHRTNEDGDKSGAAEGDRYIDEIVVPGTRIHGGGSVGTPFTVLSREDLIASGSPNFDLALRFEPQMFGAGAGPISHSADPTAQSNSGFGVSANLRGFGPESTLVMFDDSRLASSGASGRFTDISNFPMVAIDHVDVITDGSSALYGANAVGGVVNFVSRDGRTAVNETTAYIGSVTRGGLHQALLGQFWGIPYDWGNAAFAVEYYRQTPLETDARDYASSDQSTRGGSDWDTLDSNPGTEFAGGTTFAIPRSSNGRPNPNAFRPNTSNQEDLYQDEYLVASQERESVYGTVTRDFGHGITASFTAWGTLRKATQDNGGQHLTLTVPSANPYYINPAGGTAPVQVGYDFAPLAGPLRTQSTVRVSSTAFTLEAAVGDSSAVQVRASNAGELESQHNTGAVSLASANAAAADTNPATALNPFGEGQNTNPSTLANIERTSRFNSRSTLSTLSMTFDGTLAAVPAGDLKGAFGIEYRAQQFDKDLTDGVSGLTASDRFARHVNSATAEFQIPILDGQKSAAGFLDASLASRIDAYSDVGSTVEPQVRFVWKPGLGVQVMTGVGRSVQEPNLSDLSESSTNTATLISLPDSRQILLWSGSNRSLAAERALSRRLGLRWASAPGDDAPIEIQLSYFSVSFADRIAPTILSSAADALNNPLYANIVTRDPDKALMQRICANSLFYGGYIQCMSSTPTAVVDLRLRNGETLYTQGIDFSGAATGAYSWGRIRLRLRGTYLFEYAQRANDAAEVSLLNTLYNPIDLRMLGSAEWELHDLGAILTGHFTNEYRDTNVAPVRNIASWTTFDLLFRYRPDSARDSWLHGLEFDLGCQNIFNRKPPSAPNPIDETGFDPANTTTVLDRFINFRVQKRW